MVQPTVQDGSSGSPDERLGQQLDAIAADVGLSGMLRVDLDGNLAAQQAYGLAHRGLDVPNTVESPFGARRRPAVDRRPGHGRAPPRPPFGDR
jgi:hypothetical protein